MSLRINIGACKHFWLTERGNARDIGWGVLAKLETEVHKSQDEENLGVGMQLENHEIHLA